MVPCREMPPVSWVQVHCHILHWIIVIHVMAEDTIVHLATIFSSILRTYRYMVCSFMFLVIP